jgi:hypothetical protein
MCYVYPTTSASIVVDQDWFSPDPDSTFDPIRSYRKTEKFNYTGTGIWLQQGLTRYIEHFKDFLRKYVCCQKRIFQLKVKFSNLQFTGFLC